MEQDKQNISLTAKANQRKTTWIRLVSSEENPKGQLTSKMKILMNIGSSKGIKKQLGRITY